MTHANIVNAWYRQHLTSGPIARNTEAYNQLTAALPSLIADLDSAGAPGAPVEPSASETGKPTDDREPEPEHDGDDAADHHDA